MSVPPCLRKELKSGNYSMRGCKPIGEPSKTTSEDCLGRAGFRGCSDDARLGGVRSRKFISFLLEGDLIPQTFHLVSV
ncbi:hypothetical protein PAHAL_1G179000 [Panicum hallii]|uniref:Uncharacterized protein n=1 Tax=Panicum hallii TaxID=206008 RepID=A0A2S3GPN3_9POAL|nr:hypothetical protein PAHAL_1G179000 [Panicum hallii]